MDWLATEGFEPAFGARPVKRVIQRRLQDPLAMRLLEEDIPEGTLIRVDRDAAGDGLTFEPVAPVSAEGSPA